MKRTILLVLSLLPTLLVAQDTAPGKRLLAADDSTKKLAILQADGTVERELKVGAIHDAQLLPNGNLLYQRGWKHVVEESADGKVVWEYDGKKVHGDAPLEIHAFQRLDDGSTMIAESGVCRIIEVDSHGKITKEFPMQVKNKHPHRDTRLVRKLKTGHYLAAHEGDGLVKEYDATGKVVWEYEVPLFDKKPASGHGPESWGNAVFSATRLENGNTLIGTGNGHSVLEVTPEKKIVWQLGQKDLPGITLAWVCRVERLANGNTLINNCHAGPENPQLIEVSREKKVVWQWKDFTRFGNSTPVAFLLD
jgi:outer membrane protein assembly factor BamB